MADDTLRAALEALHSPYDDDGGRRCEADDEPYPCRTLDALAAHPADAAALGGVEICSEPILCPVCTPGAVDRG